MTREQAKSNLIKIGVEEPTDEQVSNYLNQVNGETQREKDKAEHYKKEADKVRDLTTQLEEMQSANLTDIEKANIATEDANRRLAELQKEMDKMKAQKRLADMGITGEDAETLIVDGSINYETLAKIISDRENSAAIKKEQEIANFSSNPNGGMQTTPNNDTTPADVKNAETISFGNSVTQDAKDYYKL